MYEWVRPPLAPRWEDTTSILLTSLLLMEFGYHGPLDRGVQISDVGRGEPVYNVITISQYALALCDAQAKRGGQVLGKLTNQLEAILAHVEDKGDRRGFSLHRWDNAKYKSLRAPWVSALSQGNGISALLRGYQLLGDPRLLHTATTMFDALERSLDDGGVRDTDACGHIWFEEYPTQPPLRVLNGFIFALWGVLDFARATGDKKAWRWWNEGIETLRAHLADFDCGYWSFYDLHYRELVSWHYQVNIHAPQVQAMHRLTGERLFYRYGLRWRRYGFSLWSRARWWVALRMDALRRNRRFD